MEWYTHLCEYYNVSPEEALRLGTRSSGRKPNLPGSSTCDPVIGMTYEDIWDQKERNTVEEVFQFYKDQGAWSAFRQVVRHKDMVGLHMSYINFLISNGGIRPGSHICEYGAGVAPFVTTILSLLDENSKDVNMKFTVVDVDCEHLNFAKYRLNAIKEERNMKNIELFFETVEPDKLPSFSSNLDSIFCFEVLEHVPSPLAVLENFNNNLNSGGFYIENFIKHETEEDDPPGPDLESAKNERDQYYENLKNNFYLIHPDSVEKIDRFPNETRIWQKV